MTLLDVYPPAGSIIAKNQAIEFALQYGRRQHPIESDAVAIWRFDETSQSDNLIDYSGNGNDVIVSGTYQPDPTPGLFGGARLWQDDFPRFQNVDGSPFHLQNFTAGWWVRNDSANGWGDIFEVENSIGGAYACWLRGISSRYYRFSIRFTDLTYVEVTTTTPGVRYAWEHVCVTWDGVTLRIYLNGISEDSDATGAGKTIKYDPADAEFTIGLTDDGGTSRWDGAMDDGGFYSTARSPVWVASVGGGTAISSLDALQVRVRNQVVFSGSSRSFVDGWKSSVFTPGTLGFKLIPDRLDYFRQGEVVPVGVYDGGTLVDSWEYTAPSKLVSDGYKMMIESLRKQDENG